MIYNINENQHEQRFVQDMDIQNNINIIIQSDYDLSNHHLNEQYDLISFGINTNIIFQI